MAVIGLCCSPSSKNNTLRLPLAWARIEGYNRRMSMPESESNAKNEISDEEKQAQVKAVQSMFLQRMLGENVFALGDSGPLPKEELTEDQKTKMSELLSMINRSSN